MGRPKKLTTPPRFVSLDRIAEDNRNKRRALEETVWRETTAGWLHAQARADDPDLYEPTALRLAAVEFTDDELEDF